MAGQVLCCPSELRLISRGMQGRVVCNSKSQSQELGPHMLISWSLHEAAGWTAGPKAAKSGAETMAGEPLAVDMALAARRRCATAAAGPQTRRRAPRMKRCMAAACAQEQFQMLAGRLDSARAGCDRQRCGTAYSVQRVRFLIARLLR